MNKVKQLTFPWSKPSKARFEHFYFDDTNLAAKDALHNSDDLFIYGLNGAGKSFLLQSICNFYADNGKTSLYIPIKDLKKHGSYFLDSLEGLDLICIDNIDLIANDDDWELAFFNLINQCLLSGCRLIFCSHLNPSSIDFHLKDFTSRIKKIDHIEIFPLSPDKLAEALVFVSNLRSIKLGDKEINYIMTHSKRNMSDLISVLNQLDELSIQLKRKITIPLIKEVI